MTVRPLPIWQITCTLIVQGLVSLVGQFFGYRIVHGIGLFVSVFVIASMLAYHAWSDNSRVTFRNFRSLSTIGLSIFIWIPFIVVLLPGVLLTLYIDDKMDAALRYAERAAADKIEKVDKEIEETIKESEEITRRWWWPPDWAKEGTRIVERKVTRVVQEDVLRPASTWVRGVFALTYAALRVSQLVLYSTLIYIAIRSFIYLLARCALWRGGEFEFSLP